MGRRIRTEKPEDINAIYALNQLAFGTEEEAGLVNALRVAGNLSLSLVAVEQGRIVGHIAFSPMSLEGREDLKIVGLAPMAVLPEFQKSGIGSQLIQDALKKLKKSPIDAVFVLGHPDYYPKFGFLPSQPTFQIKSVYEVPDEIFMALELRQDSLSSSEGIVKYSQEFDGL